MKRTLSYALLAGASWALLLSFPGRAGSTCLDAATSVEIADVWRTGYLFDVTGAAVDARGVHWAGIPDHAIRPDGTSPACWVGGDIEGPYPEDSVYECEPLHCPAGICPVPCWTYHTTAGLRADVAAPMTIEDIRISDYGDGIERSVSANREPLSVKGAYLHDIHDDAIENDWGAAIQVVDSLLERVNVAFASRPRSDEDIDASDRAFEVRDSLILGHRFTHSYRNRPGHGGFWKWPSDGRGPDFIVTGNTFVVTDEISGSLVLPLVNQVRECANNTLLWGASQSAWDDWLTRDLDSDGLDNAGRVAALSHCFTFIVKPDPQNQADFLAQHFDPLVEAWKQTHPAATVRPPRVEGCGVDATPFPDYDQDGARDVCDNCVLALNSQQSDTDLDGYGNACDADYDNDGFVNVGDFIAFRAAHTSSQGSPRYDAAIDVDSDGVIGAAEFNFFRRQIGKTPGPSGLACAGTIPCPEP